MRFLRSMRAERPVSSGDSGFLGLRGATTRAAASLFGSLLGLVALSGGSCSKSDPTDIKPLPSASAAPNDAPLEGVDTASLTPRERRELYQEVNELLSPCTDTPVSIAQCIREKRACKTCVPAAQMILKQVQAGRGKKEREEAFHARFDAGKTKSLDLNGSPSMGPPDALITIVEWADFECPFCRLTYPLLDELVHRFPGQVRLVYKFYPLSAHPHGEVAARAAIAALQQDKFWEMHHTLFDHQEQLEQTDLEAYAKQVGLDLKKFRADMVSKDTTNRIEQDKKQAEGVGLEGTPFIFINGREVDLKNLAAANPYEDLVDWVKLDIELLGKVPAPAPKTGPGSGKPDLGDGPAPTTSASGAPSAGPSAPTKPSAAPTSSAKAPPGK